MNTISAVQSLKLANYKGFSSNQIFSAYTTFYSNELLIRIYSLNNVITNAEIPH